MQKRVRHSIASLLAVMPRDIEALTEAVALGQEVELSASELEPVCAVIETFQNAREDLAAALVPSCCDAARLRAAIKENNAVGLAVQELEHAECVLQQIVARQVLASTLAPASCDAERLRAAIEQGNALGLDFQELEHAECVLQQIVARQGLAAALAPGCCDAKSLLCSH